MPPVPDWLSDAFRQFPVVALMVAAGWAGFRLAEARRRDDIARTDKQVDDYRRWAEGEIARVGRDKERAEQLLEAERAKADRFQADHVRYVHAQARAAERRAKREGG